MGSPGPFYGDYGGGRGYVLLPQGPSSLKFDFSEIYADAFVSTENIFSMKIK